MTELTPQDNFPDPSAFQRSAQVFPKPTAGNIAYPEGWLTFAIASATDNIERWGRNVKLRDRQLREFWLSETYLAGAVANVSMRNAAFDWEIVGEDKRIVQILTDMFMSAMAGDAVGWTNFMLKFSQDLYIQDNGAFVELIRDPVKGTRFVNENAPVVAINTLDSWRCQRTGNPETPVLYTDIKGKTRKMKWYDIIPMSDFPSPIERMYGVGVCAVTRVEHIARIMRSIATYKDEKISGRNFQAIHIIGGIAKKEIKDLEATSNEELDNKGAIRYAGPMILASIDPEKPVSTATIDLASLPDSFNIDDELRWYINGLALGFGVDYQEFAPLPSGNIGSSAQSEVLHRKGSGKGPAVFMRTFEAAMKNYGVMPEGYHFQFKELDLAEESDKQGIRTKAMEEYAIAVKSGILSPEAVREDARKRGLYDDDILNLIEEDYGEDIVAPKQTVGDRSGQTIAEDARRTDSGKPNENNRGGRLRKSIKRILNRNKT